MLVHQRVGRTIERYSFVAPGLTFFGILFIVPAGAALVLSFFDWQPLFPPSFVGLDNYRTLFADPYFWNSLKVSLITVLIAMVTQLPCAVFVAMLLTRKGRFVEVVRIIIFLPIVISLVASALLWKEIFSPIHGLANELLAIVGLGPLSWLGDTSTALGTLMFVAAWGAIPLHVIIQMSALSRIPSDLLEAAAMETRTDLQIALRIKIPLLAESIAMSAVLIVTASFAFLTSLFFVMTRGGPGRATEILAIRAYVEAFSAYQLGEATAIVTVSIFVMTLLAGTFLRLASTRRVEF